MTKSTVAAQQELSHFFLNGTIPNIGDATGLRGSTTVGSVYIVLFTQDPTVDGDASTHEANYSGYTRVAVPRDASHWVLGVIGELTNVLPVTFPQNNGSSQTITHYGVTTAASGASVLHRYGPLSTPYVCATGAAPNFLAGVMVFRE